MKNHIFLTGSPGIGKTTLIKEIWNFLKGKNKRIVGFFTEELRENHTRIGFDVVLIPSQKRSKLARVSTTSDDGNMRNRSRYTVGQYNVDVQSFECSVMPILKIDSTVDIFIIDEIGKMELFSSDFKSEVIKLLTNSVIVGTLPIKKGKGIDFVENIKQRDDVSLFNITKENRNSILSEICNTIMK